MEANCHTKFSNPNSVIRCIDDEDQARIELEKLTNRTTSFSKDHAQETVDSILNAIQSEGDKALIRFTEKFDGYNPVPLKVKQEELTSAWEKTPKPLKQALELAHKRIYDFHQRQKPNDLIVEGEHGELISRRWKAVKKAGIYIPGGRASYPSTVLMNAIPAQVAGVEKIIMVSPGGINSKINSTVLAAAHLSGITNVFRIGGAQAIAALAFGTQTIPMVDVITGPGNLYVTLAKKAVYGRVGIDSLAGPSEVLIIADHSAKLEQVAADLLAQAEHDPLAAAILLTTEKKLARNLPSELLKQLKNHPRKEICQSSLKNWGLIITCKNLNECIKLSDQFAPEHLEVLVEEPLEIAKNINNAGAIFIGPWTPEAVGDYLAGPNHTLPTSGTSRFSGALGVETFMKNTSIIQFNKKAFINTCNQVKELANSEGLHSHAESIRMRTITESN